MIQSSKMPYGNISSMWRKHCPGYTTNKKGGLQQRSAKVGHPRSVIFRVVLLFLRSYIAISLRSKSHWWSRFRRRGDSEQEVPTNGQDGSHQYDSHYSAGQTGVYPEDIERPRVPLIVLAQQGHYQPDYYPQEYVEYVPEMDFDDAPMGIMSRASRLSTITELTERTEPSRHRPSGQYLTNGARGSLSTDTTSSYGQVINRRSAGSSNMFSPTPPLDPNDIPPSPSPSAIQRLSIHDSAPSALSTDTGSEVNSDNTVSPRAPSVSVPPVDTIPDIPDSLSRVSDAPPPPPEKDFQPRTHPPKRSKLATLASSRASTISSSRSSDLETTSILTYPALRPSAESRFSYGSRATSAMAPSEVSEKSDRTARGNPTASEKSSSSVKPPSTTPSSMSSHVRRAIRTAMELEAHDHESTPKARGKDLSETSSISTIKPAEPSPVVPNRTLDSLVMHGEPDTKSRPQSKLAKLAQAKANASVPLIPKSLPPTSPLPLPKPHTEYLTPIANGATATTAITTSYQSLHSLSVSHAPPPLPLVQMPTIESRQSKLAMKVKKGQSKPSSHSSTTDEEWNIPSPSPLFLSKSSRSRQTQQTPQIRERGTKTHRCVPGILFSEQVNPRSNSQRTVQTFSHKT
ncbi:hypothetical protein J3A83DRAFT_2030247 [Scleroderma citrinum]